MLYYMFMKAVFCSKTVDRHFHYRELHFKGSFLYFVLLLFNVISSTSNVKKDSNTV